MVKKVKKLKIYYIANARMPNEKAHGIQLAKMCEAFVGQGADFELILPNKKNKNTTSLREFYGLNCDIKITTLPVLNIAISSRLGFNISALTFAISYFSYLLFEKLRKQVGIIYTIDLDQFSGFLIPFLGWPYFLEAHGAKRKTALFNFFLKHINGLIVINNAVKNHFMTIFKVPAKKILVRSNGIDMKFFTPLVSYQEARRKLNLPLDKKIIVYTGGFLGWKGLEIFPVIAQRLAGQALVFLVGGTADEFKSVTGYPTLPSNLVCVGCRDYKEIPFWLLAADILVVLGTKRDDYSYYQTSPMKLFEYMAAKRPVVASRTPAVEQIVSGEEVIFYQPDNVEDLAAKINGVICGRIKTLDQVEKAYQKVRGITWDRRAQDILNLIHSKL